MDQIKEAMIMAEDRGDVTTDHYTLSPWLYEGTRDDHFTVIRKGEIGRHYVAEVYSEADARLIAAAPDLLEALIHTIKLADDNLKKYFSGRTKDCAKAYAMCAAAIAKATGA